MESSDERIEDEPSNRGIDGSLLQRIMPENFKEEFKILLYSSIPLILNNFSQTFLPIISLFFCGHIGPKELGAVTLANTFINIAAFATIIGLSSACDTLFPQLFGGDNKRKLGLVLQKALIVSVLSCLPAMGFLLNVKFIMQLFIQEQDIIRLADLYLVIFLPSILFYSIHQILQRFVLSQNIFYPILIINLSTILLNALFHWIFIFVFQLGVEGAAISVDLSNFCIMIAMILFIYFDKSCQESLIECSKECFYDWTEYLKLAIPGWAMLFFEWTNFEIGIIASGALGKVDLSVMSISVQTVYTAFMIPLGIATAANIRIGQLLGEGNSQRAKNSAKVSYIFNYLAVTLSFTSIISMAKIIPYAFTSDKDIIDKAVPVLMFVSFAHFMDASQGFSNGILRAVGAQLYGFVMNMVSFYLIGLPIGIFLMFKTDLGVMGFWIGFSVAAGLLLLQQVLFISRIDWLKTSITATSRHRRSLSAISYISTEKLPEHVFREAGKTPGDLQNDVFLDEPRMPSVEEAVKLSKSVIAHKIAVIMLLVVLFFLAILTRELLVFEMPQFMLKLGNSTRLP